MEGNLSPKAATRKGPVGDVLSGKEPGQTANPMLMNGVLSHS